MIRVVHVITRTNIGGPAVIASSLLADDRHADVQQSLVRGTPGPDEGDYFEGSPLLDRTTTVHGLGRSPKPLDDLLTELQHQRSSIGVVADEYGRTIGITTVEDILEEVVGEIEDETDPLAGSLRRLANGDWYVRGHVSLGDLEEAEINLPVDTDAFNSIGGYVFDELGRLPKRGDVIRTDGWEIRVEQVRENRVEAVRIIAVPGGEADDSEAKQDK